MVSSAPTDEALDLVEPPAPPHGGRWWPKVARWLVGGRFVTIPLVVVVVLWLGVTRQGLGGAQGSTLAELIPADLPAFEAQRTSLESFLVPVIGHQVVVQHHPDGLALGVQAATYVKAVQAATGELEGAEEIIGVVPLTNEGGVIPSSSAEGTTVVSYVYFPPWIGTVTRVRQLEAFVDRHVTHPEGGYVGVTGALPARAEQGRLIKESLPFVEVGSIVAVALVVGVMFRSLAAPLLTLAMAGMAYVLTTRLLLIVSEEAGIGVGEELQAVIVALLVGVTTDYVIFFLARFRRALRRGLDRLEAARTASTEVVPLVLTAALTVAAGTGALAFAELGLFAELGPGLALAVLVSLVLCVLLMPAAMGIAGGVLLWPGPRGPSPPAEQPERLNWRERLSASAVRRPWAGLVAALGIGILFVASLPARHIDFAVNLIDGLPDDSPAAVAAAKAAEGFVPGIVAPTEVVMTGDGVVQQREELIAVQERVQDVPGVAGVLGPAQLPIERQAGLFLASSGDVARYIVVLEATPYSADAIERVQYLKDVLPLWLAEAGIDADVALAGDTAVSAALADLTRRDLLRVAVLVLVADFVLIGLFLRAIVAPLLVLLASTLTVLAALSFTALVSQLFWGVEGLTFYVPVAAFVLLISFAADYSVYIVGRIWHETADRPFEEAIVVAGSHAAHAIAAAGLALAATFGLLLSIPLAGFRQFGLAMVLGILIDIFFVRSFLLPSLIAAFGKWVSWPNRLSHRRIPE